VDAVIQKERTVFPSHVVRQAAHQRIAPGVPFPTWIEQQWLAFSRRFGYRVRNGDAHAHFDRYLEGLG